MCLQRGFPGNALPHASSMPNPADELSSQHRAQHCTAYNLAREGGRGEGKAREGMQEDKRAAMNGRRGGIAEMKGKKRPHDLQNAESSL